MDTLPNFDRRRIEIFKNIKELEAPPGFEPGMEVLQSEPGRDGLQREKSNPAMKTRSPYLGSRWLRSPRFGSRHGHLYGHPRRSVFTAHFSMFPARRTRPIHASCVACFTAVQRFPVINACAQIPGHTHKRALEEMIASARNRLDLELASPAARNKLLVL
jgi:hypothetical protein